MDSRPDMNPLPFPERANGNLRPSWRRDAGKQQGWSLALRHAQVPFHPNDRLLLLYGHPLVSRLGLHAATDRVLSGEPVVYLDGAHTFDPFVIGRLARARRQQPRKVMAMIHVARAFSSQQIERLLSDCLASALERYQAHMAVVSGLFDTLDDSTAPDRDTLRMVDRLTEAIRQLTRQDYSLLCLCPFLPKPVGTSRRLLTRLGGLADRTIRVSEDQGTVRLDEEGGAINHAWEVAHTVLDRR